MANELRWRFNGTANLYAIIRRAADGYVYDGTTSSFVAWADGSIDNYDIALTSKGGDLYAANMPTASASNYDVDYYQRSGSTPATSDYRLGGQSFYWNGTTSSGGSTPTASEMVTTLKQALAANPGGIVSISSDGQTVTYDRAQALAELKFWQREAAQELGTRPRAAQINLKNF